MSRLGTIARRTFLFGAAAVAGGAAFGYYVYQRPFPNPLEENLAEGEVTFNPYVRITADGAITVIVPRAEMGQGVTTTLAALVAEELDVGLDQISVEHGPAAAAYANLAALEDGAPFPRFDESLPARFARDGMAVVGKFLALQLTGGSTSTVDAFDRMRQAGAMAREALKGAAARRLGADLASLRTGDGAVHDPATGTRFGYGELAAEAASDLPSRVEPRRRDQWRLLGRSQPRVDMLAKATGAPVFGVDLVLPDMVHATVKMSPRLGAPMLSMDAGLAEGMPGVLRVVPIDGHLGAGFGVIATSTWHAMRGADMVEAEWGEAPYPSESAAIWTAIERALDGGGGTTMRNDGRVERAFADAPREAMVEAEYRVPFLAHAAMEPINATARFADGVLDVWVPNQAPTLCRMACAREAGIDEARVNIHTPQLGGGFGRRFEVDAAVFATRLALEAEGHPVKMTWSREEDMAHDMYRPAAMARCRARLGSGGLPEALDMTVASPSLLASLVPRFFPGLPVVGPDPTLVDGLWNQPYAIPSYRATGIKADVGVPVGMWRSVGCSINGFVHECFLDEVAHAGGVDPVALRRRLLAAHPVALGVVDRVAEMARWGAPLPADRAQGIAFGLSFGGWVAQIVQVAETPDGVRIEKVFIAADIGLALDPSIVEAQLVSGSIFGLSAAMSQEITFADGRVEQSNFHDFDAMRMHQCPQFEVAILETAPRMSGVGEIATPTAAPALVNAIHALTGERIRELPLSGKVRFA